MTQPYDFRSLKKGVYGHRRTIHGEIVALLHITFEDRGLILIETKSRALRKNEIHELMITDEKDAAPGGGADRVSAIAFFEVKQGGVTIVGDDVSVEDTKLGLVAGYDRTHMPNHMNILIKAESLKPPTLKIGDRIKFKQASY